MFESREDLVRELIEVGLDRYAAQVGALAQPCLYFEVTSASSGHVNIGGSKFGGSPDVPEGTSWPYRAALPHVDAFNAWQGNELASVWGAPQPLTFFAQIDLGEAAEAYSGQWPLPTRGRLQFFWDSLCGCYGHGMANTRVIWDSTEPSQLLTLEYPTSGYPQHVAGLPPVLPERQVRLRGAWSCPDKGMIERLIPDEELHELLDAQPFRELYWERRIHAWSFQDRSLVHRMLGWCTPIQDEPAIDAAAEAAGIMDIPVTWPTAAIIESLLPSMKDWLLLFQVDLADAYQDSSEGMVYFMASKQDVRAGRFDRATAVYQQT